MSAKADGDINTLKNQVVCGQLIGQATGWDDTDSFTITLYGFVPHPQYKGPKGNTIAINFERGFIEIYDEEGAVIEAVDLIDAIKDCPVDRID